MTNNFRYVHIGKVNRGLQLLLIILRNGGQNKDLHQHTVQI